VTAANGASILLAGFDGNQTENNASSPKTLVNPLQDSSAVGKVSVSLSTTSALVNPGFDWALGFQSSSAIWGSASAFTPAADTSNNNAVYAHDALATIEMTITNTGTFDVTLDKLLMRVKRDNTNAATGIRVTYVSGDLSDTAGSNALFALNAAASTVGYDFALSNLISDFTLAAGQSATFTWASDRRAHPVRQHRPHRDRERSCGHYRSNSKPHDMVECACLDRREQHHHDGHHGDR
jgi:hypothetical protein